MKIFILSLVLVAVGGLPQHPPPASPNSLLVDSFTKKPECKEPGIFCSPDCLGLLYCPNSLEPLTVSCKELTKGQLPYCDEDTVECVKEIETCKEDDTSSLCLEKTGRFPDITNCRAYIECVNNKAYHYVCDTNTVYNQSAGFCHQGVQCYDYSPLTGLCRNKNHLVIPYMLDHKFYVYCTTTEAILMKCEGKPDDHIEFDPKKGTCSFACSEMGMFKDPKDPHYYYECVKIGNVWQSNRRKCAEGLIFDEKLKMCVNEDQTTTHFYVIEKT